MIMISEDMNNCGCCSNLKKYGKCDDTGQTRAFQFVDQAEL